MRGGPKPPFLDRIQLRIRDTKRVHSHLQRTVAEYARPKSATAFEPLLRTRTRGLVHPITGRRFTHAFKFNRAHEETDTHMRHEIESFQQHIAPEGSGRKIRKRKMSLHLLIHMMVKKSDLPPVVGLVVKEAITLDAAPRATHHLGNLPGRIQSSRLTMVTKKIVSRGDKQMVDDDLHASNQIPKEDNGKIDFPPSFASSDAQSPRVWWFEGSISEIRCFQ